MDRINEMLDRLAELSEEEISELQSAIVAEFETVESQDPTPQVVDTMTALADALDAVRGEQTRREAAAQELAERAAQAASRVKGSEEPSDVVDGVQEEEDEVVDSPVEETDEEKQPVMSAPDAASTEPAESAELSTENSNENEAAAETAPESELQSETEPQTEAAVETTAEAELSADDTQTIDSAELAQEDVEAAVTAAADNSELEIQPPDDRRPTPKATATAVAITAGADIPGVSAGSPLDNMDVLAEAFVKRLHALRRVNGGDGEQHIVASLTANYPEERTLSSGDLDGNARKIEAVASPQAIMASGGYCAPLETRYEIFGFGSTDRPVRDSLARFGADRGGIRFSAAPAVSGYANAVDLWTAANDITPASPTTKPCLTVTCPSELTATADAVTLCLQFGNLMTRAYPELVRRHNELALVQHAREAELALLAKIEAAGLSVTAAKVLSTARDFLTQIGKAASGYRYRNRLDPEFPLRLIVPAWVRDAVANDLAMQMPGDNALAVSYAEIDGYIRARNVNATWSLEGVAAFAAEAGSSTLDEFPATFEWDLFAEGTFLFLDGGTLDIGIIRDSTLVGTNDYKMFTETFEGIAKVGVESIHVTTTTAPQGVAAALEDMNP